MKWIAWIGGIMLALLAAVYVVAFTAAGNSWLAPQIEKRLSTELNMPVTLSAFTVRPDHFELALQLGRHNRIEAAGNYSLFSRTLAARYRVRLDDLAALEPLIKQPLQGAVHTDGNLTGTFNALTLFGQSDIARSHTRYEAHINDFDPVDFTARIDGARLADLLYIAKRPAFLDGRLDVDLHAAPLKPETLQAALALDITEGRFNTAIMHDEFNVSLPQTHFNLDLDSNLSSTQVLYTLTLRSNLAQADSKGSIAPKPFAADLTYNLAFKELAMLKPLTGAPLRGPFATKGRVKGNETKLIVEGASDVAKSAAAYHAVLAHFKPQTVVAKIRHAHLDRLLYLAGEDAYAGGLLRADINLANLDPKALKGTLNAKIENGMIHPKALKRRYGIDIPASRLDGSLDAALDTKTVRYDLALDSSLAKISSKGSVIPETLGMDLTYSLYIAELGLLESMTHQPLRGPLELAGKAKGDRSRLNVAAATDLAKSDTRIKAVLENLAPRSADVTVTHLSLGRLLYQLGRPHYADGDVTLTATLRDLREGKLDGSVQLALTRGKADVPVVAKAFEWPHFKGAAFSLHTDSVLQGDHVDSVVTFDSDLAKYRSRRIRYALAKQLLTADFTATVPDLSRLYFITERPMRGGITLEGDLRYDKTLLAHVKSDTLGGHVAATLDDSKLHAKLDALDTLQALHMLTYPEIFKSRLDGTLDYDLATKKGLLDAKLQNGRFTKNVMFDLLKQYSPVDLYRERFKGTLQSRIDDKLIDSDLFLRSNRSSLKSEHALFNAAAKTIDATIHVDANNNPIDLTLKGSVAKPDISVNAQKLLEREAGKQINRLLNDLFK